MEGIAVTVFVGLGVWTAVALAWWLIALRLTALHRTPNDGGRRVSAAPRMLSVFKPVPELGRTAASVEEELACLSEAIGSFVAQLDPGSELLLGIPERDRAAWDPILRRWRHDAQAERLRVVYREEPDRHANPKIAWQETLAALARGDLWLWSDADVLAPPGFLKRAREEWAAEGEGVLTHTYVARRVPRTPGLLEAIFVNVEFFPGTLLLGRLRALRFGFGASMLFEAEAFRRHADWKDLGASLAEDYALGQWLRPVRLGTDVLETYGQAGRWREALGHYARWQKTIRWCQPAGFAGQLFLQPVIGWAALACMAPSAVIPWLGVLLMWQFEALVALALFRRVGCPVGWRRAVVFWAWPMLRPCVWLACWLPWPVRWRGRLWWPPRAPVDRAPELAAEP